MRTLLLKNWKLLAGVLAGIVVFAAGITVGTTLYRARLAEASSATSAAVAACANERATAAAVAVDAQKASGQVSARSDEETGRISAARAAGYAAGLQDASHAKSSLCIDPAPLRAVFVSMRNTDASISPATD